MFQLVWIILGGALIGGLAQLIIPGRAAIPFWLTVLLGILGGVVGNIVASVLGVRHSGGVDWIRHVLQLGAAAVLILVLTPVWTTRRARRP